MPNIPFRQVSRNESEELFINAAALANSGESHEPITLVVNREPFTKERVDVISYNDNYGVLTYIIFGDPELQGYQTVHVNGLRSVWTGLDGVEEPEEDTSLAPVAQFDNDVTVSFNYTTARGTQKRITNLTPAFVRPSERHTGKNILVGFYEDEDRSYARKTFRTDRITDLEIVNA